jgi:RNA polymerase sigma-70 factor (ECF subfamily)
MGIEYESAEWLELRLLSDEVLMTHVGGGHPDALAVLFCRYRRLVLSVAWRILHDRGEAEDLVQSIFLEILQSATRFDAAKGSARSWILQYAYHRSFNRREYLCLRGIPKGVSSYTPDQEISPEWRSDSFEMFESGRLVQEALGHLNVKQRQILELAFYEGLTMREVAQRTGESFDSVRHHFYRAIGKLRAIYCGKETIGSAGSARRLASWRSQMRSSAAGYPWTDSQYLRRVGPGQRKSLSVS